jgi:hypothetical protein
MIKPYNMLDMVKGIYAFIVYDLSLSIIFLVLFVSSCILISV